MTEIRLNVGDLSKETLDMIRTDINEKLEDNSLEELEKARIEGLVRRLENFD